MFDGLRRAPCRAASRKGNDMTEVAPISPPNGTNRWGLARARRVAWSRGAEAEGGSTMQFFRAGQESHGRGEGGEDKIPLRMAQHSGYGTRQASRMVLEARLSPLRRKEIAVQDAQEKYAKTRDEDRGIHAGDAPCFKFPCKIGPCMCVMRCPFFDRAMRRGRHAADQQCQCARASDLQVMATRSGIFSRLV
jgi:hypothetical protein